MTPGPAVLGATRIKTRNATAREEARGKVSELSTVLLSPTYEPNEVLRLLGELNELGYKRSDVETCLLSRASFQYAKTLVEDGSITELNARWQTISENVGLSWWAINAAFQVGESTFKQHRGKPLDEIRTILCRTFIPEGDRR